MKSFLISSPAYKANGLHGTYYSIAICNDNGNFVRLIGDHATDGKCFHDYTNIHKIEGMPFSDADRFISIKEVKGIDEGILNKWETTYTDTSQNIEKWHIDRAQKFGESIYNFIYDKKGRKIDGNSEKHDLWLAENPYPKTVAYYDFLKAVIHEN
jgi:hypothetical protein